MHITSGRKTLLISFINNLLYKGFGVVFIASPKSFEILNSKGGYINHGEISGKVETILDSCLDKWGS